MQLNQSLKHFIKTWPEKQGPMTAYLESIIFEHFEVKVFCTLKNNYAGTRIKNDTNAVSEFIKDMDRLVRLKKIGKQDRSNYIDLFKQCVESKCNERTISREDKVIPFSFRAAAVRDK